MPHQLSVKNENCLNCGEAVRGNFCAHCGQPTTSGRITFKETFNNFLSIAFAFEGPLLLTIRLLITNPGKLFREYIGGKRKTYYKPVGFFILITAVYLILMAWTGFDPLADESSKSDLKEIAELLPGTGEAFSLMSANINNILFFLVLSIALVFKLFFRKKYNLAEYTSISLFITSIYTMAKIITMFVGSFTEFEGDDIEFWILFVLIFYSSFSLFQKKNFRSLVKYALVSFFSIVLYIIFGIAFFFLLVSLK